ncbi:hypothetical protein [Aquirufa sp.]|jgi:hypothetical protein|uniref:hypothetical protein n=1 Tax=Aquirufa sp. TaxID=2676249 RepID=UPI0037C15804
MIRYSLLLLCFIFSLNSWAQRKATSAETTLQISSKQPKSTKTKLPIDKLSSTWALGITTTTNSGIIGGFSLRKYWLNGQNSQFFAQLDADAINDYREFTSPYSFNGRTYTEGKLNQLIVIRPELGKRWTLLQKSAQGGPALNGILSTGPSIGLQKPYYVDISYTNTTTSSTATFAVPYARTLDNSYPKSFIIGSASIFEGIAEIKPIPGWHIKSAINLELESFKQNHMSLELGFCVDYFSKPIEMLNQTEGRNVYTTGYLTFFFGKSQ